MEHNSISPRTHGVLKMVSSLPQRMLLTSDRENLSEFVLHDLCGPHCFNLKRAAYFIDNPDFDCCKGVAGISADEMYTHESSWANPDKFTAFMKQAPFNQKVRNTCKKSYYRAQCEKNMVKDLAQELGVNNPVCYSWNLKHDNHGILIFEKNEPEEHGIEDYLNGLCVLGFCPIH